jgi:hypothetical protein
METIRQYEPPCGIVGPHSHLVVGQTFECEQEGQPDKQYGVVTKPHKHSYSVVVEWTGDKTTMQYAYRVHASKLMCRCGETKSL